MTKIIIILILLAFFMMYKIFIAITMVVRFLFQITSELLNLFIEIIFRVIKLKILHALELEKLEIKHLNIMAMLQKLLPILKG